MMMSKRNRKRQQPKYPESIMDDTGEIQRIALLLEKLADGLDDLAKEVESPSPSSAPPFGVRVPRKARRCPLIKDKSDSFDDDVLDVVDCDCPEGRRERRPTECQIEDAVNELHKIAADIDLKYGPRQLNLASVVTKEVQEKLSRSVRHLRSAVGLATGNEDAKRVLANVLSTLQNQLHLSVF